MMKQIQFSSDLWEWWNKDSVYGENYCRLLAKHVSSFGALCIYYYPLRSYSFSHNAKAHQYIHSQLHLHAVALHWRVDQAGNVYWMIKSSQIQCGHSYCMHAQLCIQKYLHIHFVMFMCSHQRNYTHCIFNSSLELWFFLLSGLDYSFKWVFF